MNPVEQAEEKITLYRKKAEKLQAELKEVEEEIREWTIFVGRYEMLEQPGKKKHGEKNEQPAVASREQNGAIPRLKKGTIAAVAAVVLKTSPRHKLTMEPLEKQIVLSGVQAGTNFRTKIYTALIRRPDVFRKIGRGEFELRNLEFVIED